MRTKLKIHIEKQRHYFANKGPSSQGYGFTSGHVQMCSSVLAWRIPGTEEPGGLPSSMGSHRVRHD